MQFLRGENCASITLVQSLLKLIGVVLLLTQCISSVSIQEETSEEKFPINLDANITSNNSHDDGNVIEMSDKHDIVVPKHLQLENGQSKILGNRDNAPGILFINEKKINETNLGESDQPKVFHSKIDESEIPVSRKNESGMSPKVKEKPDETDLGESDPPKVFPSRIDESEIPVNKKNGSDYPFHRYGSFGGLQTSNFSNNHHHFLPHNFSHLDKENEYSSFPPQQNISHTSAEEYYDYDNYVSHEYDEDYFPNIKYERYPILDIYKNEWSRTMIDDLLEKKIERMRETYSFKEYSSICEAQYDTMSEKKYVYSIFIFIFVIVR